MKNLESKLQCSCVEWFRYAYPKRLLFSIPNGGKRNIVTASIMKKEGQLSGVADLFIPESGGPEPVFSEQIGRWFDGVYKGVWIEIKYGKGTQSPAQKLFQKNITDRGYKYEICRSFDDFKKVVEEYFR